MAVPPPDLNATDSLLLGQEQLRTAGGANSRNEAGDRFGFALVGGNFNGDGFDDLAVGVPGEDVFDIRNAGSVTIIEGSARGLQAADSRAVDELALQAAGNSRSMAEADDGFGLALAVGTFNADPFDDLVVSAPHEDVSSVTDAGQVTVFDGSASGVRAGNIRTFVADEPGDRFGASLAVGDFNGNGRDDLAVGAPDQNVGNVLHAGSVTIFGGSTFGLSLAGSRLIDQTTLLASGVNSSSEMRDGFGFALASTGGTAYRHASVDARCGQDDRIVGDVNGDRRFDQRDVILALRSGRYLTGQPAEWSQGDWNGDAVFDVQDIIAALLAGSYLRDLPPTSPTVESQLRFSTRCMAEATRQRLIDFIWDAGLPVNTLPRVTLDVPFPTGLSEIDASRVARVDELDANISGWDFHATSYLLHPVNASNADRTVIVHNGHFDPLLGPGLPRATDLLLRNGFSVLVMNMPLLGFNTDRDGSLPSGATFDFANRANPGHYEMFTELGDTLGGAMYRFFLEPVVQNINYLEAVQLASDLSMLGLSGGGWTTQMLAAIDERIKLSIPVAASSHLTVSPPLCQEEEQCYAPLYGTTGDGGDGIATWVEIYALGGYGENRRQITITNESLPGHHRFTYGNSAIIDDLCKMHFVSDCFQELAD